MKTRFLLPLAAIITCSLHAAELTSPGLLRSDSFGSSVSLSGDIGFVGAAGSLSSNGSAYIFRALGPKTGDVTEVLKLTADDGAAGDLFGWSVSLSGGMGLVGARGDRVGTNNGQGSAYLFRGLDTETGTLTQSAKLIASNGNASDKFGTSVSLAGTTAIIGSPEARDGFDYPGAAYVYHNLNNASGVVTESAKLVASDAHDMAEFGSSSAISGSLAIIGAPLATYSFSYTFGGAAYVYRDIHALTGTQTESLKLRPSDLAENDFFGHAVSISGTTAVVSSPADNARGVATSGSAYLFRNLDSGTGTRNESAKLVASDGQTNDRLGDSVSLSGNNVLIGAAWHDIGGKSNQGAAYLFTGLDSAAVTITETAKVYASAGSASNEFGNSVSLAGDLFIIGEKLGDTTDTNTGKAYAGTVSSITTLDVGNATRLISGISFESRADWIIGRNTDYNNVKLTVGDTATLTDSSKVIAIGQNAGSDFNSLTVDGTINATTIMIGAQGNSGNMLQFSGSATFTADLIIIAAGNMLSIEGDLTGDGALEAYLDGTVLEARDAAGDLTLITTDNQAEHLTSTYSAGYTTFTAIPEPSAMLLVFAGAAVAVGRRRRG